MTLSRRKVIGIIGSGVVLGATGFAGGFLATRRPAWALAPWSSAGRYAEPRMRALSFAIPAPNPHNRQPWLAELQGEGRLIIHRDKALDLPETGPFERQLTIGMGCFLELLRMAAADDGYVKARPNSEGKRSKQIWLTPAGQKFHSEALARMALFFRFWHSGLRPIGPPRCCPSWMNSARPLINCATR